MTIKSVNPNTLGRANHSRLMDIKTRPGAEVPNLCPYGCTTGELDANGYCRHVVGFTLPGDDAVMESFPPADGTGARAVDGRKRLPVLPTDRLERGTVTSRVYRDVDKKPAPTPADK